LKILIKSYKVVYFEKSKSIFQVRFGGRYLVLCAWLVFAISLTHHKLVLFRMLLLILKETVCPTVLRKYVGIRKHLDCESLVVFDALALVKCYFTHWSIMRSYISIHAGLIVVFSAAVDIFEVITYFWLWIYAAPICIVHMVTFIQFAIDWQGFHTGWDFIKFISLYLISTIIAWLTHIITQIQGVILVYLEDHRYLRLKTTVHSTHWLAHKIG